MGWERRERENVEESEVFILPKKNLINKKKERNVWISVLPH